MYSVIRLFTQLRHLRLQFAVQCLCLDFVIVIENHRPAFGLHADKRRLGFVRIDFDIGVLRSESAFVYVVGHIGAIGLLQIVRQTVRQIDFLDFTEHDNITIFCEITDCVLTCLYFKGVLAYFECPPPRNVILYLKRLLVSVYMLITATATKYKIRKTIVTAM